MVLRMAAGKAERDKTLSQLLQSPHSDNRPTLVALKPLIVVTFRMPAVGIVGRVDG
jgi:hypothetical protein